MRVGLQLTLLVVVELLLAAHFSRTTIELLRVRLLTGDDCLRLVLLLGTVTTITALSPLLFRSASMKRWFGTTRIRLEKSGT